LQYLHSHKIAHRDLKPENILVLLGSNNSVESLHLCDFGVSKQYQVSGTIGHSRGAVGTIGYSAPEVGRTTYDPTKADIYSFGVVLLDLIGGAEFGQSDFKDCFKTFQQCTSIHANQRPEMKHLLNHFGSHEEINYEKIEENPNVETSSQSKSSDFGISRQTPSVKAVDLWKTIEEILESQGFNPWK